MKNKERPLLLLANDLSRVWFSGLLVRDKVTKLLSLVRFKFGGRTEPTDFACSVWDRVGVLVASLGQSIKILPNAG